MTKTQHTIFGSSKNRHIHTTQPCHTENVRQFLDLGFGARALRTERKCAPRRGGVRRRPCPAACPNAETRCIRKIKGSAFCFVHVCVFAKQMFALFLFGFFFLSRASLLKFTCVVDKDTTVHDAHTYTFAFSPSVLIKCCICPCHRTLTRTP